MLPQDPTERTIGDRQDGAVRVELAHRLTQGTLSSSMPFSSDSTTDFTGEPRQGPVHEEPLRSREHPDDHRGTRREVLKDLLLIAAVTLLPANLPTIPPAAAPTATEASNGGANKPTKPPRPLPQPAPQAQVVPGVGNHHLAPGVLGDQDHPLGHDLLGPQHLAGQRIELLLRRRRIRVATSRIWVASLTCFSPSWTRPRMTRRGAVVLRGGRGSPVLRVGPPRGSASTCPRLARARHRVGDRATL